MTTQSTIKQAAKSLAKLLGIAFTKHSSHERLLRSQYLYRVMLYLPDELLTHIRENKGQVVVYNYGCLEREDKERGNILWTSHDCGFFSCLTTTLWTLTDMVEAGYFCNVIDNTYSMQSFKTQPNTQTWPELFQTPTLEMVAKARELRPLSYGHFDHHSNNYDKLIRSTIGIQYLEQLLKIYFSPSHTVLERAQNLENKYKISALPTITVCYRGTDKHTEIAPTPIEAYFQRVERQMKIHKGSRILIQTDQAQVREQFLNKYQEKCFFIDELPVSYGTKAIHNEPSMCPNRSEFAQNLVAMYLAISKSKVLITHTGNTGFFLALHAALNGTPIVQLR